MRFLAAILSLGIGASAQGAILYAIGPSFFSAEQPPMLYRIENYATNPTGVAVGELPLVLLGDIAVDPTTGVGYVVGTSGAGLLSINVETAALFPGGLSAGVNPNALTFDSQGNLYSWGGIPGAPSSFQDKNLYQLNIDGSAGTPLVDTGYMSAGDLAYDPELHALFGAASTGDLIRIDLDDLNVTNLGVMESFAGAGFLGLDIDPSDGTLYGLLGSTFDRTARLYTVNKATGEATLIGDVANAHNIWGAWGMAFAAGDVPSPVLGDMNADGTLDAFDVAPFELALADRDAFSAAYPDTDPDLIGDFTGDGFLDAFDVAGFEAALAGGGATVPEPASFAMLLAAGLLALRLR